MKLQAHLPTVSIGARDWSAASIALGSLLAASVLALAIQSAVLLNYPLVERLRTPPITRSDIPRVSLDLHSGNDPINPSIRFSVAHPLPANVASSQRFSIGIDERAAFELFGEAALRSDEGTVRQIEPHNDRMLLMLMLLRLNTHRS